MASHDSIVVQEPKKIIEIIEELPSLLDKSGSAQNFYRLLSNDACHIRHLILEPDILEYHLPLDNEKDLSGVIGSLGPFSELPPEIVSMIFMQADIESLTKFRSVSRAARDVVDSLFKYRNIVTHAPQILRATLALKAGEYITLTHLDAALMSKVCQDCGEFGAFLHVPTCERVCYKCFTANEDRMPLSAPHVRHKWRLTKKEFAFWKEDNKIRTLPGRYRIKGRLHRSRTCYVSNEEALRAKIRISGKSREEVIKEVNSYHKSKMIDYQIARQFGQTVRRPPYSPDPSPKARPKEARFQVVVGMPCVSERSENGWLEWGISCTGCRDRKPTKEEKQRGESPQIQLNKAKLYTRSGFVEHVLTCPYAQELLEANYGQIHQSNIEIPDDTSNSCALVSNGNNVTSGWGIWSLTPCTNFLVLHRSSVSSP